MDLKVVSGLDIALVEGQLKFGGGLQMVTPSVRRIRDMNSVLYEPAQEDCDLYYMFRNVAVEMRQTLVHCGLRYDITMILPRKNGREYNKTAGHYHPLVPNTLYTYPEVYEVFCGTAHYLLQKLENGVVTDAVLVEAHAGDKVLIPPGYGHITINAADEILVMSNWVADTFDSLYAPILACGGGAYFALDQGGKMEWVVNSRYASVPPLRRVLPREFPEYGLVNSVPMHDACCQNPALFSYLMHPGDDMADVLSK